MAETPDDGSGYVGDSYLADFLETLGISAYGIAAMDSALQTASGIASMIGGPVGQAVSMIISMVQLALDVGMNAHFQQLRLDLGTRINNKGGIQELYFSSALSANYAVMNKILGTNKNKLLEIGNGSKFSQLVIFGGQTMSETMKQIGLYATVGTRTDQRSILSDLAQSTENFANTVNAEEDKYKTKVNLFTKVDAARWGEGKGEITDQWMQNVDMSEYIHIDSNSSVTNVVYTGLMFYSPLVMPPSFEVTNHKGGKNQETVKFLRNGFAGMNINLAHKDLTQGQVVVADFNNLLVSYVSGLGDNQRENFLKNNVYLGNSQYYLMAGLVNTIYANSATIDSGSGMATIDYDNLSKSNYESSIRMVSNAKSLKVNKVLKASAASYYFQEASDDTRAVQVGKNTAVANYLTVKAISGKTLSNQYDEIVGGSVVNTVVSLNGKNNIMTGYNGMTLQGGENATYYFNKNSNNFNQTSFYSGPSIINIAQGRPKYDANTGFETALTSANEFILSNIMDFDAMYFSLNSMKNLVIVNSESNQAFVIYDFFDNYKYNTFTFISGNRSQRFTGEQLKNSLDIALKIYIAQTAKNANEASGGMSGLTPNLFVNTAIGDVSVVNDFKKLGQISNGSANYDALLGSMYKFVSKQNESNSSQTIVGNSNECTVLDYSVLSNIYVDVAFDSVLPGNRGTVKKRDAQNTLGTDYFSDISQVFGTVKNDFFRDIHTAIDINTFGGNDAFYVQRCADLSISGMGVSGSSIDLWWTLNEFNSLNFYLDRFDNLHINSLDEFNNFHIQVIGYNKYKQNSDLTIKLNNGGKIVESDIDKLVSAMAVMNEKGAPSIQSVRTVNVQSVISLASY